MSVHWTDEARASVVPRRGHGDPPVDAKLARKALIAEVELCAKDTPGTGSEANSVEYRWEQLRKAIAVADQRDNDAALDLARTLWARHTDLVPRCALAYVFPDEADWADVATRALLDQIKKQKGKIHPYEVGAALLGAVASPPLQLELARAVAAKRLAIWVLVNQVSTMVDLTGDAAAPALAALLATAPSNDHKLRYASALALIESPDAAAALAGTLSSKVVLPIAKSYFEMFPALAKTALGKVAKTSGTSAPIAALLLRG